MQSISSNKLASLVIFVLLVLLLKNYLPQVSTQYNVSRVGSMGYGVAPANTPNRLVVQESSMSMVVADVRNVSDKITEEAKRVGGYMVSTSLTSPEEAPFATVVIRVPSSKLKQTLDYFRGLSVKVTDENLLGTDVTDQYVDLQARLETLNRTKAKYDELLNKATAVQDILAVQQQLTSLEDQIDSLKGQQIYLEQTAKLAKMTVYLSTDEFSLPYAPSQKFRPEVIFKEAVRSLVSNARNLAGILIWILVYSVIWLPLAFIIKLVKNKFKL